ncbi:hypothetical protein ALC57_01153, partial [Trachymyrmex cornetzi]
LDFVINTDQTGCQYEMTYNRALDFQGVKTVFVEKQSLNKLIHSYTAQYYVTASGKLLPLVSLGPHEPSNKFSPTISKKIQKLSTEFKNVVTCSKSGKLTNKLYKQFLGNILVPYVNKNKFMLIINWWEGQTDPSLHDEIFENDSGETTCTLKFIPPKCTPLCQPYDIYFHRQTKIFIKKLQHAPILLKNQREIASREDATKMLTYAWLAKCKCCCFPVKLLKKHCACTEVTFIKYAWFEVSLCFTCFYDKYHPISCSQTIRL